MKSGSIENEWTAREQRKLQRRLRTANLHRQASLEDIDWQSLRRGLDRALVRSLAKCAWIAQHRNLLLIGPMGIGKSWLAEAFAERACRSGYSAYCVRAPRLFRELQIARGDGSYLRVLARLAKIDLVAIDDLGLAPLSGAERHDPLELLADDHLRSARAQRLRHQPGRPSMRDPSTRARGATTPASEAGPTGAPDRPRPSHQDPESGPEGRRGRKRPRAFAPGRTISGRGAIVACRSPPAQAAPRGRTQRLLRRLTEPPATGQRAWTWARNQRRTSAGVRGRHHISSENWGCVRGLFLSLSMLGETEGGQEQDPS